MSLSDGQGNIIINCQECGRTCVTIEAGKVIFSGIGMSVTCVGCEVSRSRSRRGGFG